MAIMIIKLVAYWPTRVIVTYKWRYSENKTFSFLLWGVFGELDLKKFRKIVSTHISAKTISN